MDMNKLTQKSQEAFYEAQNTAIRFGHQEVDVEHLALALLKQENGLIPRLFSKMNIAADSIAAAVEDRRFRLGRNALRAEPAPCTDCQKRVFPFCTGFGRKSALIWQENMI